MTRELKVGVEDARRVGFKSWKRRKWPGISVLVGLKSSLLVLWIEVLTEVVCAELGLESVYRLSLGTGHNSWSSY